MSSSDSTPTEKSPETLYLHSDLPQGSHSSTRPRKQAAVLVPLIYENENWSILFIRRTENERDRHSGQVAFPGGRRDPDDATITDTALRELHEEIGVASEGIELLGKLPDYLTISDFQITPVVGVIPWPSKITMQTDEVARVFSIPLAWLRDLGNLEVKTRQLPVTEAHAAQEGATTEKTQQHPVIYYHQYDNELLWGATARMTLNLTQAIDDGSIVLPLR